MGRWMIDDAEEIVLEDLRSVRAVLVAGDLSVTAAPGPARLEVQWLEGDPVEVRFEDGELFVGYESDFPFGLSVGGLGVLDDVGEWVGNVIGMFTSREHRPSGRHDWGHHDWRHSFGRPRFGVRHRAAVVLSVPAETDLALAVLSASVLAAGTTGDVRVKTVSGDVTLDGVTGPVTVHTLSGDLEAQGLIGDLRVNTASGEVTLVQSTCETVGVTTVSGDVALDCGLVRDGRYEIKTVSGDVAVWLPAGGVVDVEAASVSGRIDAGTELHAERGPGRRHVSGRFGDGETTFQLRVRTVSGDLTMLRRAAAASTSGA